MMKTSRQLGWQHRMLGAGTILVLGLTLGLTPRSAHAVCVGDCDGSGDVTVNELISMVNIALGNAALSTCTAGDADGSGDITINEIIAGVNNALNGCTPMPGGCGDGVITAPEQCDDGGTCVGTNAGTHCTAEADCPGNGICDGGTKYFYACTGDADCGGGKCIHCKTYGGDGCAANCTNETEAPFTLNPGVAVGLDIKPGTSGAVVHGEILTIPLPIGPKCMGGANKDKACASDADCPSSVCLPAQQNIVIGGKGSDGHIPVTVKASAVKLPRIPVSSLACACLRGVAAKTCGGTLFELDGVTQSTDCSDGFTAGASVCAAAGKPPCTFLHGPDNAGSGVIGCDGYTPLDLLFTQDSGGETGTVGKPIIALSGSGPAGSALILTNNAIGTATGVCSGSNTGVYGNDGEFCTDDDPQSSRGTPAPQLNTTGMATGMVMNANGTDGDDIGPFHVTGAPFSCTNLLANPPSTSGAALASSFVALNQPTLQDIVVTSIFVSK